MEEVGDSAAPKENGDKRHPPTGRHVTANGNEIINTPARFGVDKGCGNVLRRPDVFCEAIAAALIGAIVEENCVKIFEAPVLILRIPTYDIRRGVFFVVCGCETGFFSFS
jgi:hypothetical protein